MTLEERINKVLEEKINPTLKLHDGGSEVTAVTDGVCYVKFLGACANCMASTDTFDDVVKAILLEEIPELKDVKVDDTVSDDLLDMARRILAGEFK